MTIEISKETEQSLEAFMAQQGLSKDAISDVVEEAIEDYLFRQMMSANHKRNAHLDPDEVDNLVENEIRQHRQNKHSLQ